MEDQVVMEDPVAMGDTVAMEAMEDQEIQDMVLEAGPF